MSTQYEIDTICMFDLDENYGQWYYVTWKRYTFEQGTWTSASNIPEFTIKNFWVQTTRVLTELRAMPQPLDEETSDSKTECERCFTLRKLLDDNNIQLERGFRSEEEVVSSKTTVKRRPFGKRTKRRRGPRKIAQKNDAVEDGAEDGAEEAVEDGAEDAVEEAVEDDESSDDQLEMSDGEMENAEAEDDK